MSEAYINLRENQFQADVDGVMVTVSRQALDEVLDEYSKLEQENARLREAALDVINDNYYVRNMEKLPDRADNHGISARKLWALKQAVESSDE